MSKHNIKDLLIDHFDRIVKGRLYAQILVLLILIGLITAVGSLVVSLKGSLMELPVYFWWAFLHILDPGYLGEDNKLWLRLVGFVLTIGGLVIFGLLISILNTAFQERLAEIKKGKRPVFKKDHFAVLGWNSTIYSIIKELSVICGSDSIVILSDNDREYMEDEIGKYCAHYRNKVICRTGKIDSIPDLERVNILNSKGTIILPKGKEHPRLEDSSAIRAIFSLIKLSKEKHLNRTMPISMAISNQSVSNVLASLDGGYLKICVFDLNDFLGRIIAQCTVQYGLDKIYYELLSFKGSEFYTFRLSDLNIKEGHCFEELHTAFSYGIPVGLKRKDGKIILNPSDITAKTPLAMEDSLILLSDSKENVVLDHASLSLRQKSLLKRPYQQKTTAIQVEKPLNVLVIGGVAKTERITRYLCNYLPEGSVVYPTCPQLNGINKSKIILNPIENFPDLDAFCRYLDSFPSPIDILILAEDEDNVEMHDTEILLKIAVARQYSQKRMWKTKIVAEFLDPYNANLAESDVAVISTKLVSSYLVQVITNPDRIDLFKELLSPEGNEICVRPFNHYCEGISNNQIDFKSLMSLVRRHNEIAIGYIDKNNHIILNPDKEILLSPANTSNIITIGNLV